MVSAHLVEQMAQRLALQGDPEVVLLVNVHQLFPERFQLRHAGLGVVHEHPRPAVFQDLAPDGQPWGGGQVLGQQPTFKVRRAEPAFHHSAVRRQPHTCGVGPLAKQQAQGAQQDALARSGFAGEDVEPFVEVELHFRDEGVVSDVNPPQHQPKFWS